MSVNKLTEKDKGLRTKGIAWKKAFCSDGNEVLVLLSFDPRTAMPEKGCYYVLKCPVTVLAIFDMWGYRTSLEETKSLHDRGFAYQVGETVRAASGIWAWPTFNEAVNYWRNERTMHGWDERYEKIARRKPPTA